MAQNIYDNPEFFSGYSQLPRQVQGLGGAPEWPAIRALLPELGGKRVADLGCGFGWASRWFREQGAASVLGLDLSQNMIERARADTTDSAIAYRIADLDTLEFRGRAQADIGHFRDRGPVHHPPDGARGATQRDSRGANTPNRRSRSSRP